MRRLQRKMGGAACQATLAFSSEDATHLLPGPPAARSLLPGCHDLAGLVQGSPRVLDTPLLRHVVGEIQRLYPGRPPGEALEDSPGLVLALEDMNKEPRNDYEDVLGA